MPQAIKFDKMHGLGNDFVIVDSLQQKVNSDSLPIKMLAHRHLGIGFDQLLLIEKSDKADFFCRIFNADGSEAEQCGNGLRCVALYAKDYALTKKNSFVIATKIGEYPVNIVDSNNVQVDMGIPSFEPLEILKVNDEYPAVELTVLSIGNPHAIFQVTSIEEAPVETLGPLIATHQAFSNGINVGFMEIVDREHIRLKTFERGVGKTYACGSNACAAVIAGIRNKLLDKKVVVELPFGDLTVEWPKTQAPIKMSGPAARVFAGTFEVENLG